jgi:hypothetical protein
VLSVFVVFFLIHLSWVVDGEKTQKKQNKKRKKGHAQFLSLLPSTKTPKPFSKKKGTLSFWAYYQAQKRQNHFSFFYFFFFFLLLLLYGNTQKKNRARSVFGPASYKRKNAKTLFFFEQKQRKKKGHAQFLVLLPTSAKTPTYLKDMLSFWSCFLQAQKRQHPFKTGSVFGPDSYKRKNAKKKTKRTRSVFGPAYYKRKNANIL